VINGSPPLAPLSSLEKGLFGPLFAIFRRPRICYVRSGALLGVKLGHVALLPGQHDGTCGAISSASG
jgi:hypothetical protein